MSSRGRTKERERHRVEDGTLLMDCRGCGEGFGIEPSTCLRCLCTAVHSHGEVRTIVVRDGMDRELGEKAYEDIVTVSRALSWCDTDWKGKGRCMGCRTSPAAIRDMVWSDLPIKGIKRARMDLNGFRRTDERCLECVKRTMRSVERAEDQLEGLLR